MPWKPQVLAGLTALFTLSAPARAAEPMVRVLNEANRGVASDIQISASGEKWEHAVFTDADGSAPVSWKCSPGRMLRAAPRDSGSYFNSRPEDCTTRGPLRVISRYRLGGFASAVSLSELSEANGGRLFVVLSPVVKASATEHSGWGDDPPSTHYCSFSVNSRIERTLYREGPAGEWFVVSGTADFHSAAPLPVGRQLDAETIQSPCNEVAERIEKARKRAAPAAGINLRGISGEQLRALSEQFGARIVGSITVSK
jgi:hypothetical protein